jgi:hypothetical protein
MRRDVPEGAGRPGSVREKTGTVAHDQPTRMAILSSGLEAACRDVGRDPGTIGRMGATRVALAGSGRHAARHGGAAGKTPLIGGLNVRQESSPC